MIMALLFFKRKFSYWLAHEQHCLPMSENAGKKSAQMGENLAMFVAFWLRGQA